MRPDKQPVEWTDEDEIGPGEDDPDNWHDCPYCEGDGCDECDGTGEYEV